MKFWLTIFLPTGVQWECANNAIRSRDSRTGRIIMRSRKVNGPATSWITAAHNLFRGIDQ